MSSAAINNAMESEATRTNFLANPENPESTTVGFKVPGCGPRDLGALEYEPIGKEKWVSVGTNRAPAHAQKGKKD